MQSCVSSVHWTCAIRCILVYHLCILYLCNPMYITYCMYISAIHCTCVMRCILVYYLCGALVLSVVFSAIFCTLHFCYTLYSCVLSMYIALLRYALSCVFCAISRGWAKQETVNRFISITSWISSGYFLTECSAGPLFALTFRLK